MDEIEAAIAAIQKRKQAKAEIEESNSDRTKRLWRRASYRDWQYKHDFIRGKYVFFAGLPHVFKSTAPRYLLSKKELEEWGLKPGKSKPVCHTYNQQAGLHYLYDVRDCERINGKLAGERLKEAIATIRSAIKKGGKLRLDILLQALCEHDDIPF